MKRTLPGNRYRDLKDTIRRQAEMILALRAKLYTDLVPVTVLEKIDQGEQFDTCTLVTRLRARHFLAPKGMLEPDAKRPTLQFDSMVSKWETRNGFADVQTERLRRAAAELGVALFFGLKGS